MNNSIAVTSSSMPPFEEYCEEIKEIWESRCLTNMGVKHKTLEAALVKRLKVPFVSLFTNGHLALEAVLRAMNLHGEVITTPFTFASTTHAIARCGLTPVFCDIKADDFTMDPLKIEALITNKTCAIVPVHVYGNLCDDDAIEVIAKKYDLKVVYDAAHAFAVFRDGLSAAAMGDASMFSFHATKAFNTIEGGAISYSDDSLTQALKLEKNFGITGPETVDAIGGNAKMNEFQAAMGLCNLRHFDEEIAKRSKVDAQYRKRLCGVAGISIHPIPHNIKANYAYFPVVFDGYRKDRDEVFEELKENDIKARKYFFPATNSFSCYKANPNATPVALHASLHVLALPMFADLDLSDVNRICDIILA